MDAQVLIESFSEFKEAKNIDRATMMSILEDVIRGMLRKRYGTADNFDIIINTDKGDLEIWRNRTIVEDGMLELDRDVFNMMMARENASSRREWMETYGNLVDADIS